MKKLFGLVLCTMYAIVAFMGTFAFAEATYADTSKSESRYSADIMPLGGSLLGHEYRYIYYHHKEESLYINPYEAPIYGSSYNSSCAVDAGGNLIAYYDRLYDELIPDYKHKYIWGGFVYGAQNDGIDNMFASLYSLMKTTNNGTTIPNFKSGLTSYVNNKGRSIQITQTTGNYYNTNYELMKTQLAQEKMGVMFMDTFSLTALSGLANYDGYDKVSHTKYTGYHTVLLYGYYDVSYYNADNSLIQRDSYFLASTGYAGADLAFININNFITIDDAYIIHIS